MKTFTIEQIRKYILSQGNITDEVNDILYNLSEENIIKANEPIPKLEDLRSLKNCDLWQSEECDCTIKCSQLDDDLPIDYLETF